MHINPTRTQLQMLKEKARSIANSCGMLRARRLALLRELLDTATPFVRSRREIAAAHAEAKAWLEGARRQEGAGVMESVVLAASRDFPVTVRQRQVWGLRYHDVSFAGQPLRHADGRGYDVTGTVPDLEEAAEGYERLLEAVVGLASYEGRLRALGREIAKTTRRIRIIEERSLPGLRTQIDMIGQYLEERERESSFRLRKFKELRRCP